LGCDLKPEQRQSLLAAYRHLPAFPDAAAAVADLDPEHDAAAPDPATGQEICRCILGLADTLKPEYATVLRRVEVEGMAVQDFAAEAGITANNAGVRLFRAREALRTRLQASCRTCADHGCLDCSCGPSHPRP
jgi:RNA polymerase sigma-70 factor (ECF subfamily)